MQMDIKVRGITREILTKPSKRQTRPTRDSGLDGTNYIGPRETVRSRAYLHHKNPSDKVREVIGPGGKVINGIIAEPA